jgi:hypothetical protein
MIVTTLVVEERDHDDERTLAPESPQNIGIARARDVDRRDACRIDLDRVRASERCLEVALQRDQRVIE